MENSIQIPQKSKNKTAILLSNPLFRKSEAAASEKSSDLPKVTQLVSGRCGTWTHASKSKTGVSTAREMR